MLEIPQHVITLTEAKRLIDGFKAIFHIHKIDNEPNLFDADLTRHNSDEIYGVLNLVSKSEDTDDDLLHKYIELRRDGHRAIVIGNYS